MKHTILKIDFMPFFYVLLADLPNSPLVNKGVIKLASDISDKETISFPHQFDKDLVPLFKGFVYLLNLPRTIFDLFYFGNESKITIAGGTDWHSHAIYIIPIQNMDIVFLNRHLW